MALVRNVRRLAACLTVLLRNPRESTHRLSGLPELARGADVARRWRPASASPGFEPGPAIDDRSDCRNPFHPYVESITEGPGLWKWLHYLEPYHRHLRKFVGRPVVIVEVGVYSGGSLRMWRHYFGDQCRIHGVDIQEECRVYEDPHTTIHIGDQADRAFWKRFRESVPAVDVLIDDGGHHAEQQMVTLEEMLPYLRPGGVYICEDVIHTGNRFGLFVRSLAGELNACTYSSPEESGAIPTAFQAAVDSIHLYPFLLVIEKRSMPLANMSVPRRGTEWQAY
jgi:hypothetical protein